MRPSRPATESVTAEEPGQRAARDGADADAAQLILLLQADRPLSPSIRVSLRGVEELRLGRGSAKSAAAQVLGSERQLSLLLNDR